jgi:RimJ/RimL family protein N-acetyltransferase
VAGEALSAVTIETGRLILRDWTEEDLGPYIRHTNTPAVLRWLGGPQPEEEIVERMRARVMRWQRERGFTFWVVERKADRALLGFCGLKIADDEGSPVEGLLEVGWRLREDAWGQGYAKEAAIASLDFAFDRLEAPRVIALTLTGNRPSRGLMERLGMTRRADLDYEGPRWANGPIIVYEMERAAWMARRC